MLPVLLAVSAFGVDLAGTWNFIWDTEGGERRTTVSFSLSGEKVMAKMDARNEVAGTFKGGRLELAGKLHSDEAGRTEDFKLTGTMEGTELKGSATWGEHPVKFKAVRAQ